MDNSLPCDPARLWSSLDTSLTVGVCLEEGLCGARWNTWYNVRLTDCWRSQATEAEKEIKKPDSIIIPLLRLARPHPYNPMYPVALVGYYLSLTQRALRSLPAKLKDTGLFRKILPIGLPTAVTSIELPIVPVQLSSILASLGVYFSHISTDPENHIIWRIVVACNPRVS